jgi:hypothetical protein
MDRRRSLKLKKVVHMQDGTDWATIASLVSSRTKIQRHSRWRNFVDPTINWSNERTDKWGEDDNIKLKCVIKAHAGKDWVSFPLWFRGCLGAGFSLLLTYDIFMATTLSCHLSFSCYRRSPSCPSANNAKGEEEGREVEATLELVEYGVAMIMALDCLCVSVAPPASFKRRSLARSVLDHALAPPSARIESAGKFATARFQE